MWKIVRKSIYSTNNWKIFNPQCVDFGKYKKKAGAEQGQAQVKLDDMVEVVVDVVVIAVVQVQA